MEKKKDEISIELKEALDENKLLIENNEKIKKQFITQLKNSLGNEIKKNPNKPKIIEKSKLENFKIWVRKIFNKF